MEHVNVTSPSACYTVEKILEISHGQGNHKNYKVQWAPSWVSEMQLMGCETLIKQFLNQKDYYYLTDASQNASAELKQEDESCIGQNESESASGEVETSAELSRDKDKNSCHDENTCKLVITETNTLCDTIKIEEEDCPFQQDETEHSQESFEVHHNTVDQRMEVENEIAGSTYCMNKENKEQNQNDNHSNNNFHFDRCIKNLANNSSSTDNHDWNNISNDSMNCEVGFSHINYSEDGTDKHNKILVKKHKRVMKGVSTNIKRDIKNPRNTLQDILEYNQAGSVSTKDVSTFLQHPNSNLGNLLGNNDCHQHIKHKLVDINNDNSIPTYLGSNNVRGTNEWIDTSGHKNTSAYTNSSNPSEHTISNCAEQVSDHVNSTERDVNRNYNFSDNINVLGNNSMCETPVVNQQGEQSSNTDGLQFNTTASMGELFHPQLKDTSNSTIHLRIDQGTGDTLHLENSYGNNLDLVNSKLLNEPTTLQEYIQLPARENTKQLTFCDMVTAQAENYQRPTFCNMPKVAKERCDTNLYLCKICNITFTMKKLYKKHMKVHVEKKKFQCSICLKEFYVKDHWERHVRVHTDERPYACPVCGRQFKDYSNLKIHIRRKHTMERPHKCHLCIKKFATTSDLKKHIRIHTGECPYGCKFCTRRFKTSSELSGHLRKCALRI